MSERMFNLQFEFLDDGSVDLEQGHLEPAVINLHPAQLRLLCERAGLLKPQPVNLAEHLTAGHIRRLRALHQRIQELFDNEAFFNELFDRCSNAAEYWQHIRAIYEQAEELIADVGGDIDQVAASEAAHPGQASLPLEVAS